MRIMTLLLLACGAAHAQNAFVHFESPHVSPLALSGDGNTLLAVNTADHRLEVFAVSGDTLSLQRSIPVGLDPVSVRWRTGTEAWIVNHASDSISIVNVANGTVSNVLATGDEPADVAFAQGRAFVTLSSRNQLQVFDAAAPGAPTNTLALDGEEPRAMAVSPDGTRVYVAFFESGNGTTALSTARVSNAAGPYGGVNPPPNSGTQFSPPLAPGLPPPPPVAQIVRKNANGQWIDDNNRDWSSLVPWNIADNDVAIINSSSLAVSYVSRAMTSVMQLATAPDGRVAMVGTEARNEIRFEPNAKSIFIRAQLASFTAGNPGATSTVDLNPHLTYAVRSVPQATRDLAIGDPRGVVFHPGNGEIYVAGMGSNNLIVTNTSGTRLGRIELGQGPTGIVLNGAGTRLYALNKFDGSISVVDTTARSELSRTAFFDPTPLAIKEGRPLLYDTHATSGLGQASCAGCHVDARSDGLAWDLGDPSGGTKAINQPCRPPLQNQCNNRAWHPMKGPLQTQTLQGIVGNGAMHWRGDKENIAAFAPAFVGLQGMASEPSASDMQKLENFVASIRYPGNPNRNPDGSYPATVAVTNGSGDPISGENLFLTFPSLPAGTCVSCHALPTGTTQEIDLPPNRQPLKNAQLRGVWERTGMSFASQNNTRGFGFMSDAFHDTLASRLGPPFTWGTPQQTPQRRRDVEAFMLTMATETPAAVGRMVWFNGTNNNDATLTTLLSSLTTQADAGTLALIARRFDAGSTRGFVYATQSVWLSDRENAPTTATALRAGASSSAPVMFMAVPITTQFRMGVDRDADGVFDQDELDHGSDAANAGSLPTSFCRADFDANGTLNAADLSAFTSAHTAGNPRANWDRSFAANGLPTITAADLSSYQAAHAQGCPSGEFSFADGFE